MLVFPISPGGSVSQTSLALDTVEPLTRREQLKLNPEPKAKSRTGPPKKKVCAAKSKPKAADAPEPEGPEASNPSGRGSKRALPKTVPSGEAEVETLAEPLVEAKPTKPKAKAKGGAKAKAKVKAKARSDSPRGHAEEREQPVRKRRDLGRSSSSRDMTPSQVMDALQEHDMQMGIVLNMIEAQDCIDLPTKDNPETLPSYKHWKLSPYWTRNSIGVIRRKASGPDTYCGTFASGGSPTMASPLVAVDHFAPCIFQAK